jgi:signal transduction histidine kinase
MAERLVAQLDQLQTNDRLRRELVAHVSHDLRTPLASLHGYLETLRLKEAQLSPLERADYLDTALRQSKRLTRLVSELFELAQLDARQTEPEIEPLAVTDLVQDVVQKFSLRAKQRDIQLSIGLGTSADGGPAELLPLVLADIALTERVLENLIGNALDHTPEHGQVRLSLYRRGDRVEVTVSDNGQGIAAEHLAHIFEPFYQAGNRHRGNQHAGLGLAIARRIVELQHGELRVTSEVGHGAAFSFSMPVAS